MSFACALASQITLSALEQNEKSPKVPQSGWKRCIGWFNLHFAVYFLALPIITLYALSLCSSVPRLEALYLVQLTPSGSQASPILRVCYFAICASHDSGWTCRPTPGKSVAHLASHLNTPEHIVTTALALQRKHFLPIPAAAGLLFLFSLIPSAIAHARPQGRLSHHLRLTSLALTWISTALLLASTVSLAQTASALNYATATFTTEILISPGMMLQAFQWTIIGLSTIAGILMSASLKEKNAVTHGQQSLRAQSPPPLAQSFRRHIRSVPPPPTPIYATYTKLGSRDGGSGGGGGDALLKSTWR